MVLSRQPICADPFEIHDAPVPATVADHIMPREQGGTDAMENLQGLCKRCHDRKTAIEDGRWG